MPLIDIVRQLIEDVPGLTERQIAERIFGRAGQQQRVNPSCRALVARGIVERRRAGYAADPFTYHLREP